VPLILPSHNRRALLLLFSANTISGAAQGISMIAVPWYVIDQLGAGVIFSSFYAVFTLLSVFWVMYAGALIDRFDRRRLFIGLNAVCGSVALAGGFYGWATGPLGLIPALMVMGVTLLNFNLHYPALYAFAQEMTEAQQYKKIISRLEIQGQSTSMLSGALAALLLEGVTAGHEVLLMGIPVVFPFEITRWSLHDIFLLDGITYFISLMLMSAIRYRPLTPYYPEPGRVLDRLRTGYAYLRSNPWLLRFGMLSYGVFVTVLVEDRVLLPTYIRQHLSGGADVFASNEMLFAFGALCSGFVAGSVLGRWPAVYGVSVLMTLMSLLFAVLTFSKSLSYLFVFSFVYGFVNTAVRILRVQYLFRRVENGKMGRVLSFFKVTDTLARGFFIALFSLSWFHEGNQIRFAFLILSVFLLVCALGIWQTARPLLAEDAAGGHRSARH
jgi:MFS family permease